MNPNATFSADAMLQLHTFAYPSAFPGNLGDAGPDQRSVADEAQGEADQDRREIVSHGRYVAFQMAEVAIPRDILRMIAELRPPPLASTA